MDRAPIILAKFTALQSIMVESRWDGQKVTDLMIELKDQDKKLADLVSNVTVRSDGQVKTMVDTLLEYIDHETKPAKTPTDSKEEFVSIVDALNKEITTKRGDIDRLITAVKSKPQTSEAAEAA